MESQELLGRARLEVQDGLADGEEGVEEAVARLVPQADQLAPVRLAQLRPRQQPRAVHRALHVPAAGQGLLFINKAKRIVHLQWWLQTVGLMSLPDHVKGAHGSIACCMQEATMPINAALQRLATLTE